MGITKRQLKRIIKEQTGLTAAEEESTAYGLLMDLVGEELYPGAHGEPASAERHSAWVNALRDVAAELQLEMDDLAGRNPGGSIG